MVGDGAAGGDGSSAVASTSANQGQHHHQQHVDSIPVPASSNSPGASYDYGAGNESNVPWATDPSESPAPDDGAVTGSYMVGV